MHHVAGLLEGLSPREKEIIRYRFGLDGSGRSMTLREVGAAMGVTKERVRQLEVRAVRISRGRRRPAKRRRGRSARRGPHAGVKPVSHVASGAAKARPSSLEFQLDSSLRSE